MRTGLPIGFDPATACCCVRPLLCSTAVVFDRCCVRPLLCSTSVTESAEIIAMSHATWPEEINRALLLSEFDERFRRYRLSVPEAERALVDSLKRYGQMAPVVVSVWTERN